MLCEERFTGGTLQYKRRDQKSLGEKMGHGSPDFDDDRAAPASRGPGKETITPEGATALAQDSGGE